MRMSDESSPSFLAVAPPSLPNGNDYRELAVRIREIARQTRLPFARRELIRLAISYRRRGDHLDRRNSMFDTLVTLRVARSAVFSGALWLVMFACPASANTIDLSADIMEIVSQGTRSTTGDTYSQGMSVGNGPWAGEIYSQGMMMSTGDIYSQGMEIMFRGGTTYSPSPVDVGSPDWTDNATILGGTTSSPSPGQGCSASNCNSNGNGTNPQATSDPTNDNDTSPSSLSLTITGGVPDHDSIPLAPFHPEIFGSDNESADLLLSVSGGIAAVPSEPLPEPAGLVVLGSALLSFGLMRCRRAARLSAHPGRAPRWSDRRPAQVRL